MGDTVIVESDEQPRMGGSQPSQPRGIWELWWVRLTVTIGILAAMLVGAMVGDPTDEPWQAKTWGLLHTIAATSVGRR